MLLNFHFYTACGPLAIYVEFEVGRLDTRTVTCSIYRPWRAACVVAAQGGALVHSRVGLCSCID